jgi:hypothetical protein
MFSLFRARRAIYLRAPLITPERASRPPLMAEAPAVAKRAPPRRRKLPRAKYQLLGDGLRARFRSQWLRLTALACCFLVCKWVLRLGFLPTLLLMFTVRWFIMNPLPEKKTAEKSS